VWLWGGGHRQYFKVAPVPQSLWVFSPAKHVRELAKAAGATSAHLPDSWVQLIAQQNRPKSGKALIDLTEMASRSDWLEILLANWLIPAQSSGKNKNMIFWSVFVAQSASAKTRLYHRDLFHFFGRKSLAQYVDNRQNSNKA
jgi:hypothetical protein